MSEDNFGPETPWRGPANPTAEQIREEGDCEHLYAARATVRMMMSTMRELESAAESRIAGLAIGGALQRLEQAEGELTHALLECGYVEPKQQAAE